MATLIDKNALMKNGLKRNTAEAVIRQAKVKMVSLGYPFYSNRKVSIVPTEIVEQILGVPLSEVTSSNED